MAEVVGSRVAATGGECGRGCITKPEALPRTAAAAQQAAVARRPSDPAMVLKFLRPAKQLACKGSPGKQLLHHKTAVEARPIRSGTLQESRKSGPLI